jgi:hypothetical protein
MHSGSAGITKGVAIAYKGEEFFWRSFIPIDSTHVAYIFLVVRFYPNVVYARMYAVKDYSFEGVQVRFVYAFKKSETPRLSTSLPV